MMDKLSQKANQIIKQNLEVSDCIMTREQINSIMPEDRTNMDLLPKSITDLRVVKIGDNVDLCPCAGTHISNLSELGEISIIGKKSKGKGTQRITYELINNPKIITPNSQII